MHTVMRDTGFEGTLEEFFAFMNTDRRFIAATQDELLQSYRDMKSRIEPHLLKLFDVTPAGDYEVRAVEPFREKTASGASYIRGTPDGSRPGVFYVNTHNLAALPKWKVETLSLHEAVPGLHFQIAVQQELNEIPDFRRFGDYMAFMEGWAVAEAERRLGKKFDIREFHNQVLLDGALPLKLLASNIERWIHAKL